MGRGWEKENRVTFTMRGFPRNHKNGSLSPITQAKERFPPDPFPRKPPFVFHDASKKTISGVIAGDGLSFYEFVSFRGYGSFSSVNPAR